MTTLQQRYAAYRNKLNRLNEQKDAWYTIANQRWNEGDKAGQAAAYAEADKIQAKINALVNPMEAEDGPAEDLVFDN
jgi:predicted Zn-dependent protease